MPRTQGRFGLTMPVIFGFIIGFLLGLGDFFVLQSLAVVMLVDGVDYTLEIVAFFALNFGALGAVIARLWEQRRAITEQTEVIEKQYEDLKKTQSALIESETMAAVGRMSAGVAHEVRNPLSIIRSSAQMLREDLDSEHAERARFICVEVDRLDDFVTRVLDFSRRVDVDVGRVRWDAFE